MAELTRAAREDKIPTTALCLRTEADLTAQVGAERAAQYLDDCARLQTLRARCPK